MIRSQKFYLRPPQEPALQELNMDNQRLLLFIGLSMTILLLWQTWEKEQLPPPLPAPVATTSTVPATPEATTAPTAVATAALASAQRIRVTTDVYVADIDSLGGDLRYLALRKHPDKINYIVFSLWC